MPRLRPTTKLCEDHRRLARIVPWAFATTCSAFLVGAITDSMTCSSYISRTMNVKLAYGQGHLSVDFPHGRATVIEPTQTSGLADERPTVLEALAHPISASPLR